MNFDTMTALIAERHSDSVYRAACNLNVNHVDIINKHISTIGNHDELMDVLNVAPITAEDAADAAYWEIIKACETVYIRTLSRTEVETLSKALHQIGTLRLAEDLEYNDSSIISTWERIHNEPKP